MNLFWAEAWLAIYKAVSECPYDFNLVGNYAKVATATEQSYSLSFVIKALDFHERYIKISRAIYKQLTKVRCLFYQSHRKYFKVISFQWVICCFVFITERVSSNKDDIINKRPQNSGTVTKLANVANSWVIISEF